MPRFAESNSTAPRTARCYLDTVLAVVSVPAGHVERAQRMHILFDGRSSHFPPVRWGFKELRPDPGFYDTNHFATDSN